MRARKAALLEQLRGALWALPTVSVLVSLILGSVLSQIDIGPDSPLNRVLFQGTADDARQILTAIAAAVLTVIALVLSLTLVALQVASSQFSPRLLRNFLRDRPNQIAVSIFVSTFAYTTAGLYTVGVSNSSRTAEYPRLAVTVAIALIFACLAALVYFIDHLAHSIQIDMVMNTVGRMTTAAIAEEPPGIGRESGRIPAGTVVDPPDWALAVRAERSGYVQTVHPELILPVAQAHDAVVRLAATPGDHVVSGTPLAWIWRASSGEPPPDTDVLRKAVVTSVAIGFERTMQQDPGFGLRQLVDIASKALSPAINDPYTAVQAVNWLKALICKLAVFPLGTDVTRDESGGARVVVPAPPFGAYLDLTCGQIRRYGAGEPAVARALLLLLRDVGMTVSGDERRALVAEQVHLVLADAEVHTDQPADLVPVRAEAERVLHAIAGHGTGSTPVSGPR